MNLVRDRPDLLLNRHGPNPPAWFDAELISRPPPPSHTKPFDMKNVVQQFISLSRGRQGRISKHIDRAEEDTDMEQENDDDDDDAYQSLHKRPQTSRLGRITPFLNITSMDTQPSPHNTASTCQASMDAAPNRGLSSDRGERIYSQVASTSGDRRRVGNSLGLILYITRVVIVDQALVLERDRFGLVENLFDKGRLVEPYFQELVFGNSLYNKPTFLWFFDDTSEDKPRIVNNRPSTEAAIAMLRARAERAGAVGIQLFDAPDHDTAALVPVHEVTRKHDFVQRVSFELEIDDNMYGENNYDDNDDVEDSEKASKVDSGYESRDGELQLDNIVVKEESDREPNITWAGHQRQEDNVGSESESEED